MPLSVVSLTRTALAISAAIIVFHLFVVAGLVPHNMVWGGRLKPEELLGFKAVSIAIFVSYGLLLLSRLRRPATSLLLKIAFGTFAVMFGLGVIGNLASLNSLETMLFTPLALVLCFISIRLSAERIR